MGIWISRIYLWFILSSGYYLSYLVLVYVLPNFYECTLLDLVLIFKLYMQISGCNSRTFFFSLWFAQASIFSWLRHYEHVLCNQVCICTIYNNIVICLVTILLTFQFNWPTCFVLSLLPLVPAHISFK